MPSDITERKKIYHTLLNKNNTQLLFLQPWWLDLTTNRTWDARIIYDNGVPVDAIPYMREAVGPFRILRPPQLTPYMPNILYKDAAAFSKAISQLPSSDEVVVGRLPFYLPAEHCHATTEYSTLRPTYYIPLNRTWHEIEAAIPAKRRNQIRKGLKSVNLRYEEWNSELFNKWQAGAFNDKNIRYPYHEHYIQELIETAREHKAVTTICACVDNQPIAYIALFYDTENMYYLLGAKDNMYNTSNAMSLLIYEGIRKAHAMHLKCFDFEGSSDENIAYFFSKFGSIKTYYEVYRKTYSVLWTLKKKIFN